MTTPLAAGSGSPFVAPVAWVRRPSPNAGARARGVAIDAIVLHADASDSVDATLDWCARPEAQVSYHVVVGRTGRVFLLVPPERRAWHAGVSALGPQRDCNQYAIGVCLSNRNDGREAYPAAQVAAAADVVARLAQHYGIALPRIVRHRDVALPTGRKSDPAPPAFDLDAFRRAVADYQALLIERGGR